MDRNDKNFSYIIFLVLAGISAYGTTLAINLKNNKVYAVGFIIPVIFLFLAFISKHGASDNAILREIRRNWGEELNRKRNFKNIRVLFDILSNNASTFSKKDSLKDYKLSNLPESTDYIDEQTWHDLNMNKVFDKLDRTYSFMGQTYLYYLLRKPLFNIKELNHRGESINKLQSDISLREKIQVHFKKIGEDKKGVLTDFIFKDDISSFSSTQKLLVYIMSYAIYFVIALIPFIPLANVFILGMGVFAFNMYIKKKFESEIGAYSSSIIYLGRMLSNGEQLSTLPLPLTEKELNQLKENIITCKPMKKKCGALNLGKIEGIDILADYVSAIILYDVKKFIKVIDEVKKHNEALKGIYMTLGKLDSLVAIASYRESLEYYSEPLFIEDNSKKYLNVQEMIHPLVEEPISNSIEIKNGIIITGSNMSGKSTFLRTIGLNALLSQTIYTSLTKKYEGNLFQVLTSLDISDDVTGGKSYYLGEALSIGRIIHQSGGKKVVLSLIDEIFKGTNPIERINASVEIMNYLENNNSLTAVATHDLELTKLLHDTYNCYYFKEDVGEEGLEFDYKLYSGVSPTKNAIKLLEFIGYSETIIENTNKRIKIAEENS